MDMMHVQSVYDKSHVSSHFSSELTVRLLLFLFIALDDGVYLSSSGRYHCHLNWNTHSRVLLLCTYYGRLISTRRLNYDRSISHCFPVSTSKYIIVQVLTCNAFIMIYYIIINVIHYVLLIIIRSHMRYSSIIKYYIGIQIFAVSKHHRFVGNNYP